MQNNKDIEWYYRILEIRKEPSLATPEDILKLTDDVLMQLYFGGEKNSIFALGTSLTNKSIDNG
jgi:hypothetical protein